VMRRVVRVRHAADMHGLQEAGARIGHSCRECDRCGDCQLTPAPRSGIRIGRPRRVARRFTSKLLTTISTIDGTAAVVGRWSHTDIFHLAAGWTVLRKELSHGLLLIGMTERFYVSCT
jgi:hypothetical protein